MQRYLLERNQNSFTSSRGDHADSTINTPPRGLYDGNHYPFNDLQHSHVVARRYVSPPSSGVESSSISSCCSDRQGSPWSSPEMMNLPHPLSIVGTQGADLAERSYGGHHDMHHSDECVAMNDVQKYADHQTDAVAFEEISFSGFDIYNSFPQESYQECYQPMPETLDEHMPNTDYNASVTPYPLQPQHSSPQASQRSESDTPVLRRRRPQFSRSVTSPNHSTKVSKRVQPGRRSSHQDKTRPLGRTEEQSTGAGSTAFPCALQLYGCTSTFGSKNEWKRHIATQHMRLDSWRCAWCLKVFNRKDLFVSHVRRMHAEVIVPLEDSSNKKPGKETTQEQAAIVTASDHCYRRLRSPPNESQCLLCEEEFRGPGSWDERMEHLGRHLENAKKGTQDAIHPQDWQVDSATHEWLINEEIVVQSGTKFVLADKT